MVWPRAQCFLKNSFKNTSSFNLHSWTILLELASDCWPDANNRDSRNAWFQLFSIICTYSARNHFGSKSQNTRILCGHYFFFCVFSLAFERSYLNPSFLMADSLFLTVFSTLCSSSVLVMGRASSSLTSSANHVNRLDKTLQPVPKI